MCLQKAGPDGGFGTSHRQTKKAIRPMFWNSFDETVCQVLCNKIRASGAGSFTQLETSRWSLEVIEAPVFRLFNVETM